MADKEYNFFALLIGIGQYPIKAHILNGPENDVALIEELIDRISLKKEIEIQKKKLLNEQATRENIIKSFSLFKKAKKGDQCLLYFSGHGSRIPGVFFEDQQDGLIESIVCYDSRLTGGLDLADKELAFLLKDNISPDVDTLVLMDSCHAGQNTRGNNLRSKNLEDRANIRPIESYLGWAFYDKKLVDGKEKFSITPAPHIQMAACAPFEKAQELSILGEVSSVFTFSLHEAIVHRKMDVNYAELIQIIRLRAGQFTNNQTPQLETIGLSAETKNEAFLNGAIQSKVDEFFIYMDGDAGWKLNAGQMHSVEVGDEIFLKENESTLLVETVDVSTSQISGVVDLSPAKIYACNISRKTSPAILVYIDIKNKNSISWVGELNNLKRKNWAIVEDEKAATHFLHFLKQDDKISEPHKIVLSKKGFDQGEWDLIPNEDTIVTAFTLGKRLDEMATFLKVINISNPHSLITNDHVQLSFKSQETFPQNSNQELQGHDIYQPIRLTQFVEGEQTFAPLIALDITNTSNIPLFTTVQVLGNGYDPAANKTTLYSMTNRFMQQEMLMPGETKGMIDYFEGKRYTTIPLTVMPDYLAEKGLLAKFYLKIWISTQPFDSNSMNQEGFKLGDQYYYPSRNVKSKLSKYRSDWQTFTGEIEVVAEEE